MAVFVETPDLRILLDAGVALGRRSGLLPHPKEYQELQRTRERIRESAQRADFLTISHYHFDHYTATWKDVDSVWTWSSYEEAKKIYAGKTILAKEYRKAINYSQRERGYLFTKIAKDFAKEIRYMDSMAMKVGETSVEFSEPRPHGEEGSLLGYVLIVSIRQGDEHLMHCADVQGPISSETTKFIIASKPTVLILSGPPLYLSGFKVDPSSVRKGVTNLRRIVQRVPLTVVDHHLLRDRKGLELVGELSSLAGTKGNDVKTAAEYLGKENRLLESERASLYESERPSEEFVKWTSMREAKRRKTLPPLD